MTDATDRGDEALRREHLERLLERHAAAQRDFGRSLAALLAFAVLFPLLVLLPYLAIRADRGGVQRGLSAARDEIEAVRRDAALVEAPQLGLAAFRERLAAGPAELAAFIRAADVRDAPTEGLVGQLPPLPDPTFPGQFPASAMPDGLPDPAADPGPCAGHRPGEQGWWGCVVGAEMRRLFAEYRGFLVERVLEPLRSLPTELAVVDAESVATGLDDLEAAFERRLESDPFFFEYFDDKGPFFVGLGEELDAFWAVPGSSLATQSAALRSHLDALESDRSAAEARLDALQGQEQELAARLERLESPVGRLPVGLVEAIALFPLVTAVGFLLVGASLERARRLRAALRAHAASLDPGRAVLTDAQVALVAPVWLDPLAPRSARSGQLALLAVAPLAVTAAAAATLAAPGLLEETRTFGAAGRWAWWAAYALAVTVSASGFGRLASARGD